ncbi:MAG: LptF/LptG family permease [Opitutae bacterium]|nr:LptF/LptG family permease [Opitutae bacterium]
MKTFDRYLLREWLQIIGLVLAATLGLLLVQVMYDDLFKLINAKATAVDIGWYFAVTVPSFLSIMLPLALLVSLLYALGQLHRHHEFTALRAAGVSLWRITAPVWLAGILCCGIAWWLNASVVPWSVEESRRIMERVEFTKQAKTLPLDRAGAVTSVAFDNRGAGRTWFFNRFSRFTQRGYGVTVSVLDPQRRERSRLLAAQAWRSETPRGWIFRNGRELIFDADNGDLVSTQPFAERICPDFDEDPQLMLLIDRRPIDLSFFELKRLIDYLDSIGSAEVIRYAVRYYSLLAGTLAPLIVIGLAVPFAVTGVRVNPAVGVSKAIGLFALYYLLSNLGGSLAVKHVLSPAMAAWLPNLGMAALAAWLFARLR